MDSDLLGPSRLILAVPQGNWILQGEAAVVEGHHPFPALEEAAVEAVEEEELALLLS